MHSSSFSPRKNRLFTPGLALSLAAILVPASSHANPSGAQVAAGNATIEGGPGMLSIKQSSASAIINWKDFSINSGETTKFIQPNSGSAILNRVTGKNASLLQGSLQSNGKVFLLNSNGIVIGGGARVDTNGFIASTLDIDDSQFMAGGDLKFSGTSTAQVTNLGTINAGAGDVYLIAREVENSGTINAPQGSVGLAAGSEVLLKAAGDNRLFISPGAAGKVNNHGTITAAQAELRANCGNPYALALNNTGVIRATGVSMKNGRVMLTASGGTVQNSGAISAHQANGSGGNIKLDAGRGGRTIHKGVITASGRSSGQKGGHVEIVGGSIRLTAGAQVDVSGDIGGGVALIGGDFHGANPLVTNSHETTVEAGATITADAIRKGNGGSVAVLSDSKTTFAGSISARGGIILGDGGMAEVSSKGSLAYQGFADLSAAKGKLGTLLLDPTNVTIREGVGTDDANNLYANNLEAQNASVIIQADNSITASANDPTTPFTVSLQNNVSLTMKVGSSGTIDLSQAKFITSGTGGITIGDPTISSAGITVSVNELTTGSGDLTLFGGIMKLYGTVNTGGGAINLNSTGNFGEVHLQKDLSILSNGGAIHVGANIQSESGHPSFLIMQSDAGLLAGDITFEKSIFTNGVTVTGGNVTAKGRISVTNQVNLFTLAGKTLTLNDTVEAGNYTQNYFTDHLVVSTDAGVYYGTANSGATNVLNLKPASVNYTMDIGGAGGNASTLSLSSAQISQFQFASTVLGGIGQGTINIHGANFKNVTIQGQERYVDGSLNGTSVNFETGGVINLLAGGAVNSRGGEIQFHEAVNLASGPSIQVASNSASTLGGNISFSKTINGAGTLTLIAGGGTVTFSDAIGSITPLSSLNLFAQGVAVALPTTTVTNKISILGDIFDINNRPTSISQTGPIQAASFSGRATNGIDLTNAGNKISALGNIAFGTDFRLKDTVDLSVNDSITGGTSSNLTIENHGGSINLQPSGGSSGGAKITISGSGNNLVLASDKGVFNNVGASVLDAQNGSRWVIYATANDNSHLTLNGLPSTFTDTTTVFPALPSHTGNGIVIGPISGAPSRNILIVSGMAGSGADDSQLDDNQILFSDTGMGTTFTISSGKLELLTGNILLQSSESITLSLGVNLNLAGVQTGGSIKLQTSSSSGQISLGGNITTGGGAIISLSPLGDISTQALTTGGGNVTLSGNSVGFTSIAAGAGTTTLSAATGKILDATGSTPNITAGKLSVTAASGVGSSSNPLNVSVSGLEAVTQTGGIFVTNSGHHALTIGGVDSKLSGVIAGAGDIKIDNDGSISITDFAKHARVAGNGGILIKADGTTSDITTGNGSYAVHSSGGAVILQAGRDILIGDSVTNKEGNMDGKTVELDAGHAVIADEGSSIIGVNGLDVTAGTVITAPDTKPSSIQALHTHMTGAQFGSNGGTINLTTGEDGFISLASGNTSGSVVTTLTSGHDAAINFTTDDINIGDRVDAGNYFVTLESATLGKLFDLGGNHPVLDTNYAATTGYVDFGLTNAELSRIHAGVVQIGQSGKVNGVFTTTPITIASTSFKQLFLQDDTIQIMNDLSVPALVLFGKGTIYSTSNITSSSLQIGSAIGQVQLTGTLKIGTLDVSAATTIDLTSTSNKINEITGIARGGDVNIIDSVPLKISGPVTGSGASTASNVTIRTVGDITLEAGTKIKMIAESGTPATLTLEALNGHFINNVGRSALNMSGAVRYRIYSQDALSPFKPGGLENSSVVYKTANVRFGSDPLASSDVFYFQNASAAGPIVPPPAPPQDDAAALLAKLQAEAAKNAALLKDPNFRVQLLNAQAQSAYQLQLAKYNQDQAANAQALPGEEAELKVLQQKVQTDKDALQKIVDVTVDVNAKFKSAQDLAAGGLNALFGKYRISLPANEEAEYVLSHQKMLRASLDKATAAAGDWGVTDASWNQLMASVQKYVDMRKTEDGSNAKLASANATVTKQLAIDQAALDAWRSKIAAAQPTSPPIMPALLTVNSMQVANALTGSSTTAGASSKWMGPDDAK